MWTDNIGLRRYYENRGFKHVRTLDGVANQTSAVKAGNYPARSITEPPAPGLTAF